MNKTPNYQLNQWAKSDRVLMDDFNADNAKLDAAIKANASAISAETSARISAVQAEASARASAVQAARDACPLVLLRSVTLPADVEQYDLSLRGFDWELYGELLIYMSLKPSNTASNLVVLVNNVSEMGKYIVNNSSLAENLAAFRVNSYGASAVCRIPRAPMGLQAEWWGSPYLLEHHFAYYNVNNVPRTSIRTMNFLGGLAAGSQFTILGVRG